MKVKMTGQIDITRWAIRDEPELCEYIKAQAAANQRTIRQQMLYMLKRYVEEHNNNNDD